MNFGWNYVTGRREYQRGAVTIYEYERGLLYAGGRLLRVLEAGRYRLWPFSRHLIAVVDIRRATAQITNQKTLTRDQITVTLNLVADYEITDVALAVHRVVNYQAQLHEDVQLAARTVVAAATVDELLQTREAMDARLLEIVAARAATYGLQVLAVAIKDVILAPKVRDLLMKEVEVRRVAQAMLVGAREEVAAMRALSNAARLAAEHPHLLRLRELEVARAFAQNGGNTLLMGIGDKTAPLPVSASRRVESAPQPAADETD